MRVENSSELLSWGGGELPFPLQSVVSVHLKEWRWRCERDPLPQNQINFLDQNDSLEAQNQKHRYNMIKMIINTDLLLHLQFHHSHSISSFLLFCTQNLQWRQSIHYTKWISEVLDLLPSNRYASLYDVPPRIHGYFQGLDYKFILPSHSTTTTIQCIRLRKGLRVTCPIEWPIVVCLRMMHRYSLITSKNIYKLIIRV